jgi:hypothetical protein
MNVPAQGTQTLTFAVKAGASVNQTTVTLDGGNVLVIQIADPNAAVQPTEPVPGEPEATQAPDAPTDSNAFH